MRTSLTLAATLLATTLAAGDAPVPVAVTLTGQSWTVNGQATVPLGLFGLHAVGLSPELVEDLGVTCYRDINFVPSGGSKLYHHKQQTVDEVKLGLDVYIDCQGDRFYEPLVLHNPTGYVEQCEKIGRAYGEFWQKMAGKAKHQGIVQWWNEPYLNWAERSAGERGSVIQQKWYDVAKAVEGGPVTVKGMDRPLTHFVWRERWPVRYEERTDRKTGKTSKAMVVGWSVPIPEGLEDGETFEAAETRYWRQPGVVKTWTVERHWFPVDPTAVSFWSGRQNLEFYRMMFGPWAKALREANPAVTILGGWDFNYSAGDWSVWTELYRPLLEAFPQLIDGLTEHHYGIPPTTVQAWYELGTADAMALTGRWLKNWNTECQGRLDPAVYGRSDNAPGASGAPGEQALWEARYNVADIVGLAARLPAKVGSRTAHNFAGKNFPQCGAAWALRLLKTLRGNLVKVDVGDQGLFAAAARREDGTVVLALVNSRPYAMALSIAGVGAEPDGLVKGLELTRDQAGLMIVEDPLVVQAGKVTLELESRAATVVELKGVADAGKAWTRQCFADEPGLREVAGDGVTLTVDVPAALLAGAAGARLRVVLDGAGQAAPSVAVNGHDPVGFRPDLPVTDLPLPVADLRPGANAIVFAGSQPYRLVTASVLLDGEGEAP